MKRKTFFGAIAAVALTTVLAACMYEGGAGAGDGAAQGRFTPGTIRVEAPASPTFSMGPPRPGANPEQYAWSMEYPIVLDVTFSSNRIEAINLISHGESAYGANWFQRAYPMVPDQIVFRQSTVDIDTPGGGTITRDAIVFAVEQAIIQAGANPAELVPYRGTQPMAGDLFVPGWYTFYLPAGVYDIWGGPLNPEIAFGMTGNRALFRPTSLANLEAGLAGTVEGNEIYLNDADRVAAIIAMQTPGLNTHTPQVGNWGGLFLQVSVGRNTFFLTEASNDDGISPSQQNPFIFAALSESVNRVGAPAVQEIGGNMNNPYGIALGDYWWIQQAHRQVNQEQSTLNITPDTTSGSTFSGMAVRIGMERVLAFAAGGELPHLEPRAYFPIIVDDHATLGTQLIPGRFNSIPVPGFDVTINIGTCRQVLRHINITSYVRSRVNMNNTTVPTGQAFVSQLTQSELPAGLERAAWSAFVAEILTLYARPVAEGGRTYAAVLEAADIAGHEAFSQAVKGVIVAHIQNYSITIAQQASRIGYFGPRVAATPAPAPDPTPDPTPAPDAPAGGPTTFRPGTHTGTSENTYSHRPDNDGGLTPTTIVVEIIIAADGETVESYRVVSHGETDFWINTLAMPTFTQVVNARGDIAGIDTIVGATYTSYALREAAAAAFNAARN